jgi:hypothetical protein
MRKNLMLTSLAMMVAMSEQGYTQTPKSNVRKSRLPTNRKDEVIPKGVKEYFFTESGHFFNSMPTGSYTIFYKCFALNDKNAKRKFDAYRKRHRGQ